MLDLHGELSLLYGVFLELYEFVERFQNLFWLMALIVSPINPIQIRQSSFKSEAGFAEEATGAALGRVVPLVHRRNVRIVQVKAQGYFWEGLMPDLLDQSDGMIHDFLVFDMVVVAHCVLKERSFELMLPEIICGIALASCLALKNAN